MIKINTFFALAFGLVIMLLAVSCIEDDDYTVPAVLVPVVDVSTLGTKTTFASVISRYNNAVSNGDNVGTWEFDAPLYIEAYVISSDASGNFFEEIIIQNTTNENDLDNDPRGGLKVEINVRDLSNFYNYGRKVYIKLNGLAVAETNGVITLGRANGSNLEQLEPFEYKAFVIRDQEVAIITPKLVAIGDLSPEHENTLIQINNAQFVKNAIKYTNTYAGEATDQFDGFRIIENCETSATISLQTSTFADFKSVPLAAGSGTISGIYSRDFGDDFNVLIINNVSAIHFLSPERCDPIVLNCTDPVVSATATIFNENFQTVTNTSQLDALGWTNINVSGGNERFEDNSFNGDTYLKVSAFGTSESLMEAWLVTPAINLDASTGEVLTFNVSSNYDTGKILTAFISESYTGDPLTTQWIELDANIPIGDDGFGDFVSSTINISCLNGDVHVAFKYLGAAGGAETRYHIDDIKVTGI